MIVESPLRICIPIGMYPPEFSGMGIQIQRSLPFLQARGVETTVLTRRLPRSSGLPPHEQAGTIDRILVPDRGFPATLRRVVQFRRYFQKHRGAFDVVHTNSLGWEFLLNLKFIKSLGLPVIVEMVLLGGDDPVTISTERLGSLKLGLLKEVDIWIGICGAFLPRVLEAGIPGERFRLVYPGVDVKAYRPLTHEERRSTRARLGVPTDSRIAVSVGSVIRRKGIDRLLNAWARLGPVRGRDLLLIVGPATLADGLSGPDLPFAQSILEASRAPGLEGTVRLVGSVNNVYDYFGVADLFVLLSRQEGLPIVGVEAMAAGLPCVVSPLDGIDEIVKEGKTGYILREPDDAGATSVLMSRLFDQPRERAAMSKLARQTALDRFSFDVRADTLTSLYRTHAVRPIAAAGH